MAHLIKVLPQNMKGRDLVGSDLHASFDLFLRAMDEANFDESCDRLMLGGDYIDRGPDAYKCVKILREPFAEGVIGNHEKNLLQLCKEGVPDWQIIQFFASRNVNGMGWMSTVKPEVLQDIVDILSTLPIVLEWETHRGTVGLVHADVPKEMTWQKFKSRIEEGDEATIQIALEGRDRVRNRDCSGVQGIDRVFVGHTPQQDGPTRLGNVILIDTGAVFGQLYGAEEGHLTLVNAACQTVMLAQPRPAGKLVDIKDCMPTHEPFGCYTRRP